MLIWKESVSWKKEHSRRNKSDKEDKNMIRVTIWYEYVQESGELPEGFLPAGAPEEQKERWMPPIY